MRPRKRANLPLPILRPGTSEVCGARPFAAGRGEAKSAPKILQMGYALTAGAADNGKRPACPNWETYLDDPTEVAGPREHRTEVAMPLAQ